MDTRTNENTFIVIDKATGQAIAEVSDKLAAKINASKFDCVRPGVYLPTLNSSHK